MGDPVKDSQIESILLRNETLVYKTRGVSMEPMLRQNRDLVTIRVPASRLKKYDVALYKHGDTYILHRVIGVAGDHYLIRGDNTYAVEHVPDSAVIGVAAGPLGMVLMGGYGALIGSAVDWSDTAEVLDELK